MLDPVSNNQIDKIGHVQGGMAVANNQIKITPVGTEVNKNQTETNETNTQKPQICQYTSGE